MGLRAKISKYVLCSIIQIKYLREPLEIDLYVETQTGNVQAADYVFKPCY